MSKADRKARALEVSTWLKATYPALFASPKVLPLAVGTYAEIRRLHPDINRRALATTLHWHASRPSYLRALGLADALRHDLEGNPVEPVTAEQQDYARARLAEQRKATQLARKAPARPPEPHS